MIYPPFLGNFERSMNSLSADYKMKPGEIQDLFINFSMKNLFKHVAEFFDGPLHLADTFGFTGVA